MSDKHKQEPLIQPGLAYDPEYQKRMEDYQQEMAQLEQGGADYSGREAFGRIIRRASRGARGRASL